MTLAMERPAVAQRGGRYPDLPAEHEDWQSEGNCANSTLEFIPTIGLGVRVGTATASQRAHCTDCPVKNWCALNALKQINEFGSLDGVWAGHAASLTMSLAARHHLMQELGQIAGLPDDHYLLLPDSLERRRRNIAVLSDAGYDIDQIARVMGLTTLTVKRDLRALAAA